MALPMELRRPPPTELGSDASDTLAAPVLKSPPSVWGSGVSEVFMTVEEEEDDPLSRPTEEVGFWEEEWSGIEVSIVPL
jgi:hypothetical protein